MLLSDGVLRAALCSIFVLNVADGALTLHALSHAGVYEANPVMAYVIQAYGADVFLFGFKTAIPLAATLALAVMVPHASRYLKIFILVAFFVYTLTAFWHIYLMATNYGA